MTENVYRIKFSVCTLYDYVHPVFFLDIAAIKVQMCSNRSWIALYISYNDQCFKTCKVQVYNENTDKNFIGDGL